MAFINPPKGIHKIRWIKVLLLVYNLGYALPFSLVPISILVMGKDSKPFLEKLSAGMNWLVEKAMPWLIVLLGLWLVYDAAIYFV